MIMALLALILVTGLAAPRAPAKADQILVVPFETPGRDGRTYWLGEAVSVLMADDLNARGLFSGAFQPFERPITKSCDALASSARGRRNLYR